MRNKLTLIFMLTSILSGCAQQYFRNNNYNANEIQWRYNNDYNICRNSAPEANQYIRSGDTTAMGLQALGGILNSNNHIKGCMYRKGWYPVRCATC